MEFYLCPYGTLIWKVLIRAAESPASDITTCGTVKKPQLSHLWSMALTHCAKKINQSPWPKRFLAEDVKQQTNKTRDSSRKPWHSFGQQFSQWSQHIGSPTPVRRALKKKMFCFIEGYIECQGQLGRGTKILPVVSGGCCQAGERSLLLGREVYYSLEDDRKSRIWLYRGKTINISFSGVGGDNDIIQGTISAAVVWMEMSW